MSLTLDPRRLAAVPGRRATVIADAVEAAIRSGDLAAGERLLPVRRLAAELGVSVATAAGAYDELGRRGSTRGDVGRGTFVAPTAADSGAGETPYYQAARRSEVPGTRPHHGAPSAPWRRRLMRQSSARLASAHPRATLCAEGQPDTHLLPLRIVRRALLEVGGALDAVDLQYGGAEPVDELAALVSQRLRAEGTIASPDEVTVGGSAIQLIELALRVAARRRNRWQPLVAVEEPGYPWVLDTIDRLGWPMLGLPVDAEGVLPEALDDVLAGGVEFVVLTPRAHNPTGASWSEQRRAALADIVERHGAAVVIEDDHAGDVCQSTAASLRMRSSLSDRVVVVRSFSKAIAPDLRVAAAIAPSSMRSQLVDEKNAQDGWTSRLAQRVLARTLSDAELPAVLDRARNAYAERRAAALAVFASAGVDAVAATDGGNIWVRLDAGVDEASVLEQAASSGVVALSGEPFQLGPGCSSAIRITVGAISEEQATAAALVIAEAAQRPTRATSRGAVT